jgi:hypothetical protein
MDYPYGDSGYKACGGWNNVVTTYRQAATGGTVAVTTATLTTSINQYFKSSFGYCANISVTNKTTAAVPAWTVVYDTGSASQYYHWMGTDSSVGSVHTTKASSALLTIPPGGSRYFGFCAKYTNTAVPAPVVKSVSAP